MADARVRSRIVSFGTFELDRDRGELRKSGLRLRVQEQPLRVLTMLVEHPGELVTREDLRRALWPDDTFVDFDHGLNATVNKLRLALGDTSANPRFIETVPRRGYRFVAPVQGDEPAVPVVRQSGAWLAIGVAVALAAGLLALFWRISEEEPELAVKPLTAYIGLESNPTFSPDGERVAYAWSQPWESADIYVEQIGTGRPQRLTTDPADEAQPAWSPDGRSIAFLRDIGPKSSAVMVMPAGGGLERRVTEIPNTSPFVKARLWHRVLTWAADSAHLVIAVPESLDGNRTKSLYRVSVASGTRERLTNPPAGIVGDIAPDVSPDGRQLAFARMFNVFYSEIFVQNLSPDCLPSGVPIQMTNWKKATVSPIWTPDGRGLIVASGSQHLQRLLRMPATPFAPARPLVSLEDRIGGGMAVSRAKRRLVYTRGMSESGIWRLDLTTPPTRRPFVRSTYLEQLPAISPDCRSRKSG